jgi:hypothetical protein
MSETQNPTNHRAPLGATTDADLGFNLPLGADMDLVLGEPIHPTGTAAHDEQSDRARHAADHRGRRTWGATEREGVDGTFYPCRWTDDYRRGETNSEHWHKLGSQEPPASLATLLDAYGEAMARAAMWLWAPRASVAKAREHAERADALKAEILAQFGGER